MCFISSGIIVICIVFCVITYFELISDLLSLIVFNDPYMRKYFLGFAISSFSLVGGALWLEQVNHLQACHLCILQRLIYLSIGIISLLGLIKPSRYLLIPVGLFALYGIVMAGEQSWMQYAPALVNECGIGNPTLSEQIVNYFGELWPRLFMVTGFCTQKEWTLFGLSLANLSFFCYAGYLFGCFKLWRNAS